MKNPTLVCVRNPRKSKPWTAYLAMPDGTFAVHTWFGWQNGLTEAAARQAAMAHGDVRFRTRAQIEAHFA